MKNKKTLLYVSVIAGFIFSAFGLYTLVSGPQELPKMTVAEKKARFKNLIIPAVNDVYAELNNKYETVLAEINLEPNSENLAKLRKEYRVQDNQALLMALKPHPRSIAIAQAAMESSWATSRFYREANNIFGIWSFNQDEPRIAAGEMRGDDTIWVKKYSSLKASIKDYFRTLARGAAFKEFRALKMETEDPFELVKQLDSYSEQGDVYGEELTSIIKYNQLTQYDTANP